MQQRSQQALSAMRQILRATENYARKLARDTGLTASQLLLLQVLAEHGETTAGQIAAHMGITQATTTSLLHKLEARGLVHRQRGDSDRRQVWLSLTEEGREKLAAAPDGLQEKFRDRFENLASWEQAMLIAGLERVAALLDAETIDAAPVLDVGAIDREQH
ncbi:MAG: MarR family transcriptional regulator [Kiloniellaceae bacterium]